MARKKILSGLGLKDLDATKTKKKGATRKTRNKNKIAIIASNTKKIQVKQYIHEKEKRANNPPVGLVTPDSDIDLPTKEYSFDPRFDPQLEWSGKIENSDFEIDTVSLYRHERIDPMTIIRKVLKNQGLEQQTLFPFFEKSENILPLRDAIEFYKHDQNWSNRLIAGDSLLIMNSLLEKERMEDQIQMIYIDPPYGIKYGSNFQPFTNKRDVKDGKDEDLTQEPEMIKAFRDTWELGIHSYLTYLQNRIILCKKLLHESGSCFIQISDENLHLVRSIMDEIFGPENFVSLITFKKAGGQASNLLSGISDYLIWYAKDKTKIKFHPLYKPKILTEGTGHRYSSLELSDGQVRPLTKEEKLYPNTIPKGARPFLGGPLLSEGGSNPWTLEFEGKKHVPGPNKHWKIKKEGIDALIKAGRIFSTKTFVNYKQYLDDFPYSPINNLWVDTMGTAEKEKKYVVQTSQKVIQRCILMTTDPGDIVLDPTCGSGTTSYVSEQWGRRWITTDTSRVAITIAKQRLMTSLYENYEFAHPQEGIGGGFKYKTIPHVTLSSVAYDEHPIKEILYDQPEIIKDTTRICGPFTVEAVPSPTVKSIDTLSKEFVESTQDIIQNKVSTQQEWREALLKSGIRVKGGQKMEFSRVESHPTTKWIHADAETKEEKPKRVMISFGPEYSPLDQRQVALAIEEAQSLIPKPKIIIFAAMQFDPEAAKEIDELNWPGIIILKAEMNKDLQTHDLKKKQTTSESFWLIGSPDVELQKTKDGKYIIIVNGFDYYNTKIDEIESGGTSKITMWILDTDYDGRSVYPQQVFFPMDGKSGGWNKLAKTLQTSIDEDLIIKYRGTQSIPFDVGSYKRVAVKITDNRGIESLKIINIE